MKKRFASAVVSLSLAVSFLAPSTAFADADGAAACQAQLATWMKTLHPGRRLDTDHAACKVWPADPSLTLAVQPLPHADATDEAAEYDVEVLVADSRSGAIVAHLYEPNAVSSDAVQFRGLDLDTARYRLTPQLRAFGVRANYEGMSHANPYEAQSLSLYVLDGHALRRVVGKLAVATGGGEWDTNCAGTYSKVQRTLAVGAPGAAGYATLRISETSTRSVSKVVNGDCVEKDQAPRRSAITLDYNGAVYPLPKALQYE